MLIHITKLSIAKQAAITLSAMLVATVGVLYFWATENSIQHEIEQTRTVTLMTEGFRTLVAKHGGLYVRRPAGSDLEAVGRYLASYEIESRNSDGEIVSDTFHQKNPFLALSDYSDVIARSSAKAKFRLASDNYMNPANAPDMFELAAIAALRAEKREDYYSIEGDKLRYARPIYATKACLTCHGVGSEAPSSVRSLYRPPADGIRAGGYGYKDGELVGLTSVTVPHKSPWEMLKNQSWAFWVSAFLLLSLMAIAMMTVLRGIVKPMKEQTAYALQLASTDEPDAIATRHSLDGHSSKNEIALQNHALNALHCTLRILHSSTGARVGKK